MYFPYLFGRRFELLALREISTEPGAKKNMVPIIEPVKKDPSDLLRCMEILGTTGMPAVVIANPHQGEFGGAVHQSWSSEIDAMVAKHANLIPGYRCSQTVSLAEAQSFVRKHSQRKVAILYWSPALDARQIGSLTATNTVAYHICLQDKMTAAQRAVIPTAKAVNVRDNFNKQVRNSDYAGSELYTDQHKTYRQMGVGFGDYTITGANYEPGGGKPAAVVIHAGHKHGQSGDIWMEHFVSDDVYLDVGDAGTKYLQAAQKIVRAAKARKREFGWNKALACYAADAQAGNYPGLGKNKERQIFHHMALMNAVLSGTL